MIDRRTSAPLLLLSVIFLRTEFALAQDDGAIEALIDLGKSLLSQGQVDEACGKFAEGNRLKSSPRTLILLGKCQAMQGKIASAWAGYKKVERLTKGVAEEQARYEEAVKKIEELSAKLSYLSVVVTRKVPGLEVSYGDVALNEGSYAVDLPVDPGKYTLKAIAPGYSPWSTEIEVKPGPGKQSVTIPALEPASPEGTPAPGAAAGPPRRGSTLGWAVAGVGVVATGAGLTFGLRARGTYDDAKAECPSLRGCSSSALSLRDKATTQANIANVGVGVGLLAIGLGVFLGVTSSPGEKSQQASVVPLLGPGHAGAVWGGTF